MTLLTVASARLVASLPGWPRLAFSADHFDHFDSRWDVTLSPAVWPRSPCCRLPAFVRRLLAPATHPPPVTPPRSLCRECGRVLSQRSAHDSVCSHGSKRSRSAHAVCSHRGSAVCSSIVCSHPGRPRALSSLTRVGPSLRSPPSKLSHSAPTVCSHIDDCESSCALTGLSRCLLVSELSQSSM